MGLVAGEIRSGGRILDRFGRDSLKAETAGSVPAATNFRSGGVMRDADGRIVVVAETLNAAPTAGSIKSGGRLFDQYGRLIVASSSSALVAGEILSGGEVTDSAGRVVLTNETLDAAYSVGDIESGGSGRSALGRRLVAGLTTFSPISLAPAEWYDFSTTAGGGAAISSLADLSGNGRTLTQATGAKQPTSQSAVQAGRNIGRFDGVDDELLSAAFASAQPFIIYAVIAPFAATTGRFMASVDAGWRAGTNSAIPGHDHFAGAGLQPAFASGAFNAFRQITVIFNGASSIARSNGVQDGTGTAGANAGASGVQLGATAAVQFWKGDIGEIFRVPGAVLSTDAEAYLKARWATP